MRGAERRHTPVEIDPLQDLSCDEEDALGTPQLRTSVSALDLPRHVHQTSPWAPEDTQGKLETPSGNEHRVLQDGLALCSGTIRIGTIRH